MPEGTIKKLFADKGFGFIQTADCPNGYFFHRNNVARGHQFDALQEGDSVDFNLGPSRNKPGQKEALNVKPLHSAPLAQPAPSATMLPYGFVPINLDHAVHDAPVRHDGSFGGELLSGEILCELEALTPLLPGNMRYPVRKDGKDDGVLLINDALGCILKKLVGQEPKAGKHIAEPLRLPDNRVVIAGSALKGMIRQSIGALLSAPMERVAEHHYSYRPNLDFNKGVKERYVVRPALVVNAKNDGWEIEVFGNARDALFVRKEAESIIKKASSDGLIEGQIKGVERETIPQRNRPPRVTDHLVQSAASITLSHRLATYKGGIDGQGLLASAFNDGETSGTYDLALVPLRYVCKLEITAELYRCYLKGQKKVLANSKIGHLTAHPLKDKFDIDQVAESIKQHSKFSVDQLIYVELTTDKEGKVTEDSKVVSCGHHFRYRWAYTSSVRTRNGTRACLSPMSCEGPPEEADPRKDIAPERLTGARLLFGYVHDPDTNLIGKGVYERLAGRIAINHAVSDGIPEFLSPETGYCVPLKILGQPKPSAWEFYLQQLQDKNEPLKTYGDLPNDAGGELAGRKFYRHRTSVSLDDIKAPSPDDINSDQATLARFICDTGTKFKFAIRFARLRDWELGALLTVLQPHLLASDSKPECYAHKLGLGRPLGMGSVRIAPKEIRLRLEKDVNFLGQEAGDERVKLALGALQGKLHAGTLKDWLEAHELVDGKHLDYPRYQPPQRTAPTIFDWHTNLRQKYSKLRREEGANWSQLFSTIRKAKTGIP